MERLAWRRHSGDPSLRNLKGEAMRTIWIGILVATAPSSLAAQSPLPSPLAARPLIGTAADLPQARYALPAPSSRYVFTDAFLSDLVPRLRADAERVLAESDFLEASQCGVGQDAYRSLTDIEKAGTRNPHDRHSGTRTTLGETGTRRGRAGEKSDGAANEAVSGCPTSHGSPPLTISRLPPARSASALGTSGDRGHYRARKPRTAARLLYRPQREGAHRCIGGRSSHYPRGAMRRSRGIYGRANHDDATPASHRPL